ncbi:fimbria/pilus outer membrane usher protein [Atlantibacter sp.]|uniref:fimbria/pilus outer membrane usher protein n=1 Tax=Atlantibacter sp. TaxID=1903473 RepID=UPI0028A65405|nr:fimbria/pilus outer membrane usher protein [Atlantibacter sp.]
MARTTFRLTPCNRALLHCLSGSLLFTSGQIYAREYYFEPGALEGDKLAQQDVDLSLFSKSNAQLPGTYLTKIQLNNQMLDDESITYAGTRKGLLEPQLTPELLRRWGVKVDEYPELAKLSPNETLKKPVGYYIPYASATLNFNTMTLTMSMPQAAVNANSHGYVDPSRWDDGVAVLFTDYSFSGTQRDQSNDHSQNQYLNLRSGANLGGWRVRNYSTWNNADNRTSWDTINTWVQRDIKSLNAQFIAGENSTRGEVFDSLQYRGVNIASDEQMLPFSQRGFAPVIRGVANSNAEVSIRQNGYLIYQSTVAPGPFEINDLYSTTNSGDLDVTIKEADGSEHHFTQPYSSIAIMQRPGHFKYEITAGHYRADGSQQANEPLFGQASAIYGINNYLTVFGGVTSADNYFAANSGVGVALGELGSVSMDVTTARATLDNHEQDTGQSYRLLYTGKIEATDTNFTLASYRYSTEGYYSFADANKTYSDNQDEWSFNYNKRSRIQASISQSVLESSVYLNGYQQNYWNTDRIEKSLSAGINSTIYGINVNLAYSYSKTSNSPSDQMVSFGFSVPLSNFLPKSWASYNLSSAKNGATNQHIGLSGTLLDDNRLSYSLQQSHTNHGGEDNSSVYGGYRSRYANMNAGYYYSTDNSQQINYGLNGGVVIHPGGITLSQPLGNEFAIVNANNAADVRFLNQQGIQTDWFGNAIIPSLTPYQENTIRLDTTSLPENVDSDETAITVIPDRNAAVSAHFDARVGYRAMIALTRPTGRAVPFGALATVDSTPISGIVDDSGMLYLSGISEKVAITVKWGDSAAQQCHATVTLPVDEMKRIISTTALCQ